MATYEATRYDFDGASIQGLVGIDTGTVIPWPTTSAPSGYLNCDGTAVSRSTYSALFAVVGTTYGSGNGSSTFNVPNLQDRAPVGKSGSKAIASTGELIPQVFPLVQIILLFQITRCLPIVTDPQVNQTEIQVTAVINVLLQMLVEEIILGVGVLTTTLLTHQALVLFSLLSQLTT